MAIYLASGPQQSVKTGISDVCEFFDFTFPAVAATADAVICSWIPSGARIIDWCIGVGATALSSGAVTATFGDGNTANGTLASNNNYIGTGALVLTAKTNVIATPSQGTLTTQTVPSGSVGLLYPTGPTAAALATFALFTAAGYQIPSGAVDALYLYLVGVAATAAKGVLFGYVRYTLQNP